MPKPCHTHTLPELVTSINQSKPDLHGWPVTNTLSRVLEITRQDMCVPLGSGVCV